MCLTGILTGCNVTVGEIKGSEEGAVFSLKAVRELCIGCTCGRT